MNSWLWIRRVRAPSFVILFGILACLNQWGVLSFARSWPLYLILAGILLLAERVAIDAASAPTSPGQPYAPEAGIAPDSGAQSSVSGAPGAGDHGAGDNISGENWRA